MPEGSRKSPKAGAWEMLCLSVLAACQWKGRKQSPGNSNSQRLSRILDWMGNLLKGSEADFFYAFTFHFCWRVRKMKNLLEYQNITLLISITELATAFSGHFIPTFLNQEEMGTLVTWRMSRIFRMFDDCGDQTIWLCQSTSEIEPDFFQAPPLAIWTVGHQTMQAKLLLPLCHHHC